MIKAGDLVMVVKSTLCCQRNAGIGKTFKAIYVKNELGYCKHCKAGAMQICVGFDGQSGTTGYPIKRLIKIDPPSLPETITKYEEITA